MIETKQINIETQEETFNIKKIITGFTTNWKIYAASVSIFLFAAWLYLRYATPLYKANAQVLVQNNQNNNSSFFQSSALSDYGDLFGVKNNVIDELAILQTSDLVEKLIPELKLNISYFHEGQVRSVELYDHSPFTVYFEELSDSINTYNFIINVSDSSLLQNSFHLNNNDLGINNNYKFGDTIPTRIGTVSINRNSFSFDDKTYRFTLSKTDAIVPIIMGNLSSEIMNKGSNVIRLSYNSNVAKKAEDILSGLIKQYIQRSLNEKNKISDSIISFIESRINLVADDLNNIEGRIQGFKVENKLTDISAQSQSLVESTSDYYNKLNDIDVQIIVVNTILQKVKSNSTGPIPGLLNNEGSFVSLSEKYNTIISQRDRLLLSTTESNPLIKNLNLQLSSVRNDLISNLENQQQSLNASRQKIIGANLQIGGMVASVPVKERKYVDLSRERDVKQALYLFLLQKKEETAITKSSNIPGASIIKRPKAEYYPYFPQKNTSYGTALLFGILLPFCGLWIKDKVNTRINATEDVTSKTKTPVVAEVGHNSSEGLINLRESGRSLLAEQFRIFRTNMDFLTAEYSNPIILITSTAPGEGKSFIASNLAQIYGISGKKVLLMEMDLRKPKISKQFEMSHDFGFSNYIISDKPIEDFVRPVDDSQNIFILSAGPIPPNPAELLLNKKVDKMFAYLKSNFDIIIIDSPPIAAVTDAQLLGRYANLSLYIVRQGYSRKEAVEIINDISANKKLPSVYITINDIKSGASYKYGYNHEYMRGYYDNHVSQQKSIFKKFM